MKKIGLLVSLFVVLCIATADAAYIDEYPEAYTWAYKNGITTMTSIDKANMNGEITRIALAKMISNYAINVLKKKPDTSKKCKFSDVSVKLNNDYDLGVTKTCQLGLMGQGITKFRPYDNVKRAEFGTILSRLLWGDKYNGGNPYYIKHINQLNIRGIMTNIKNAEKGNEVRGNVMVMLKRSETLGNLNIPSFEELDEKTSIKCHYETDFLGGEDEDIYLTKGNFILPYKDGYFLYDYGGQDGLYLYIYYKLKENPCTTYLNSDGILWMPYHEYYDGYNKIYSKDGEKIVKTLNCNPKDRELCFKEAKKYAYNLLVGIETNEDFSLWMKTLKKMVDNNEFNPESKEGYTIDRSQKRMDCYDYYSNKTDKKDNIGTYCYYEVMGVCPNADFCAELKPKFDEKFGGDNVIYGKQGGNYDIVGNKTFYYNENFGINMRLGKEFNGGIIIEQQNSYYNNYQILFLKKDTDDKSKYLIDIGRNGYYSIVFTIEIFDKNKKIEDSAYEKSISNPIGKNNKYQFIKETYNENINYEDLTLFDVN